MSSLQKDQSEQVQAVPPTVPWKSLVSVTLQHQKAWITEVEVTASFDGGHNKLSHSFSCFSLL